MEFFSFFYSDNSTADKFDHNQKGSRPYILSGQLSCQYDRIIVTAVDSILGGSGNISKSTLFSLSYPRFGRGPLSQ